MQVYRPLVTKLNDILAAYQLSYSHWQVIYYLKVEGRSTLADISAHYRVERPSITRRVQRLEELDIIEVVPSENRREKNIQLTEYGNEVYQKSRQAITELEYSLAEGLTKQEQDFVRHTLRKLQQNLISKEGNKFE
nr:MarR family transcriptional regulator [Gracilibacillus alcaliphilus]